MNWPPETGEEMAEVLVEEFEFEHDVGGKWVLDLSLRDHKLQICFQLCWSCVWVWHGFCESGNRRKEGVVSRIVWLRRKIKEQQNY